ncbi:MAG: GNAT family N-acetyltransferase [Streptococcaceae bacterium]|jgi:ribosomal-protein-alanine N-acetyltransferase|nr:GNAT family N-acetyltransferase [Streptococcaceae bacterium]
MDKKINSNLILAQHMTFETDRLILRKITLDDAEDFLIYHSDPKVASLAGFGLSRNLDEAQNFIINFNFRHSLCNWCLELKVNHQVIGDVGLNLEGDGCMTEIFYALNQDFWGQGLMPEAIGALTSFCFDKLAVDVIYASAIVENKQSRRVLEKLGFQPLGQIYTINRGLPHLADYFALKGNGALKKNNEETNG